jgi:hypothetical protein
MVLESPPEGASIVGAPYALRNPEKIGFALADASEAIEAKAIVAALMQNQMFLQLCAKVMAKVKHQDAVSAADREFYSVDKITFGFYVRNIIKLNSPKLNLPGQIFRNSDADTFTNKLF